MCLKFDSPYYSFTYFFAFLADKHPHLNEFLTQIKNTPDLSNLFESIQKDSSTTMLSMGGAYTNFPAESHSMDLS